MTHLLTPARRRRSPFPMTGAGARARRVAAVGAFVVALALTGCGGTQPLPEPAVDPGADAETTASDPAETEEEQPSAEEDPVADQVDEQAQQETCDWDAPRLAGPAAAPTGQDGDLAKILVGSWQHTHTDEGSGFEEVMNDHRYVFPSADRMLYCQHVPGATEYAQNAGDVVLNGTAIELPGGTYSYTVTAWSADTLVWDNPVGGGYVYLLQRR